MADQTATQALQIVCGASALHLRNVGESKTRCGRESGDWFIEYGLFSTDEDSSFKFCRRCGTTGDYNEANRQNAERAEKVVNETFIRRAAAQERATALRDGRDEIAAKVADAIRSATQPAQTTVLVRAGDTRIVCKIEIGGETYTVEAVVTNPPNSYTPAENDAAFRGSIGW